MEPANRLAGQKVRNECLKKAGSYVSFAEAERGRRTGGMEEDIRNTRAAAATARCGEEGSDEDVMR